MDYGSRFLPGRFRVRVPAEARIFSAGARIEPFTDTLVERSIMLGRLTRITYTSVDDFSVVGVHTIRPFLVRGVFALPLAVIGFLFLIAVPAGKNLLDQGWLCTFTAVFFYLALWLLRVDRVRVTPTSAFFKPLPAYGQAVAVHVTELQSLLDAADGAVPLARRTRRRVDRVVRQTQYVATLFYLAAEAESSQNSLWWERVQRDDADDLQQVLAEQDSNLIQLRRAVRAELREAVRQPA
jgi:hypothetical protein